MNKDTTPTTHTDEELTDQVIGLVNDFISENKLVTSPNPLNLVPGGLTLGKGHPLIAGIMHLIKSHREQYAEERSKQAEDATEFMVASSILATMTPLMVHRLEAEFPSMTKEIIEQVYAQLQVYMKPFMDKRKAQLSPRDSKETKGAS